MLARTIAVVGLSPRMERPSYRVAEYLQRVGYRIVPVHPGGGRTLGRPVYPDLLAANVEEGPFDIVNVFRRPEAIPSLVPALLDLRPSLTWLQEGVTHPEAEATLRAAGLAVVSDRCLMVEHGALFAR